MDSQSQALKEIVDKAPAIIAAAKTPYGLAATVVLVLGVVGSLWFRKSTAHIRLAAFAMLALGSMGLLMVANTAKAPSPAFDLADNAKATISRTTISGNPSGVFKQSGSAEIKIEDSLIEGNTTDRSMPPTNEENSRLTKEDLRAKEKVVSERLKKFQSDMDANLSTYLHGHHKPGDQDELLRLSREANQRYQSEFREDVSALAGELSKRIGTFVFPSESPADPASNLQLKQGAAIVRSGKFVGPSPAASVASFLDYMAEKLSG